MRGQIAIEPGVDVARALHALVGQVAERAAAHDLGQRLERILARQPLRHHEAGALIAALPSAAGSSGKGLLSRKRMVRSSGADSSSVAAISSAPKPSRAAHRRMLATQSRASTRSPSCQNRPSRKRQVPLQLVVGHDMPGHHLGRDLERRIHAVERVVDHEAVVSRNLRG